MRYMPVIALDSSTVHFTTKNHLKAIRMRDHRSASLLASVDTIPFLMLYKMICSESGIVSSSILLEELAMVRKSITKGNISNAKNKINQKTTDYFFLGQSPTDLSGVFGAEEANILISLSKFHLINLGSKSDGELNDCLFFSQDILVVDLISGEEKEIISPRKYPCIGMNA